MNHLMSKKTQHQLKAVPGSRGSEYVILPSWLQTFQQEVGALKKHVVAVFDWMFANINWCKNGSNQHQHFDLKTSCVYIDIDICTATK